MKTVYVTLTSPSAEDQPPKQESSSEERSAQGPNAFPTDALTALEETSLVLNNGNTITPSVSSQLHDGDDVDSSGALEESSQSSDDGDTAATSVPSQSHDGSDVDSTYEDEYSDSTSIQSYSLEPKTIDGRIYWEIEDSQYHWAPSDESQNDALDCLHFFWYRGSDNNDFRAPIGESPQQVLDIGTGTGIWAMDFANAFPSAEVIGVDIHPNLPTWVAVNLRFQVYGFFGKERLTFDDNCFDFIHIRCLAGCAVDWEHIYRELHRILKPGGWVEHAEMQLSKEKKAPAWRSWGKDCEEFGRKTGRPFDIVDKVENWMVEGGFGSIQRDQISLPGPVLAMDIEGRILYTLLELGVNGASIELMKTLMYHEAMRGGTDFFTGHRVWGQKPATS